MKSPRLSSTPSSSGSSEDPMLLSFVLNHESETESPLPCYRAAAAAAHNQAIPLASTPLPTLEPRCSQDAHSIWPVPITYQNFHDPAAWTPPETPQSYCEQKGYVLRPFISSSRPSVYHPPTPPDAQQAQNNTIHSKYSPPPPPPHSTPTSRVNECQDPAYEHTSTNPKTTHPNRYHSSPATINGTLPPSPPQPQQPYSQPYPQPRQFQFSSNLSSNCRPKRKDSTKTDTIPSPTKGRRAHSNTPYTLEQVDFLHYCRDTLNLKWDQILEHFRVQFPLRQNPSEQGIQGRYYRDQIHVFRDPVSGKYSFERKKGKAPRRDKESVPGRGGDERERREGLPEGIAEWEDRKVRIRDRKIEGIKELELQFELIYLGAHPSLSPISMLGGVEMMEKVMTEVSSSSSFGNEEADFQADIDMSMGRGGKSNTGSGAERLLTYQWSVIRESDREKARKILARRDCRAPDESARNLATIESVPAASFSTWVP